MHFNIFPHHPSQFDLGRRSSQIEAFSMLVRLLLRIRIIQINRFLRGAIQHGWPGLNLSISYWSRGRIFIPKLKSVLLRLRFGKVPRRQMPLAPRSRGAPGMNYWLYCWFLISNNIPIRFQHRNYNMKLCHFNIRSKLKAHKANFGSF